MSSDSGLSDRAPPSDAILEKTLRDIVRKAEVDPITVKRVRTAAEERLGLDAGFFKSHDEWNEKSKEIIEDAFVRCNSSQLFMICIDDRRTNHLRNPLHLNLPHRRRHLLGQRPQNEPLQARQSPLPSVRSAPYQSQNIPTLNLKKSPNLNPGQLQGRRSPWTQTQRMSK